MLELIDLSIQNFRHYLAVKYLLEREATLYSKYQKISMSILMVTIYGFLIYYFRHVKMIPNTFRYNVERAT